MMTTDVWLVLLAIYPSCEYFLGHVAPTAAATEGNNSMSERESEAWRKL